MSPGWVSFDEVFIYLKQCVGADKRHATNDAVSRHEHCVEIDFLYT